MKKVIALLLALAALLAFPVQASAAEVTEAQVPVTLTVINTVHPISVTVPAALPVSVVNGHTITANNACITNNGETGAIRVTAVSVLAGSFGIGSYEAFAAQDNTIALRINGCPTEQAGPLSITEEAFPAIAAGGKLPIDYSAKVAATKAASNVSAATVIFTIAAAGPVKEG